MANRVLLYAYNDVNSSSGMQIPLLWHVSVRVFDYEFSFGERGITINRYGEHQTETRHVPQHPTPTETVNMGYTCRTSEQILRFIESLSNSWNDSNYNVVSHNCIDFAITILTFLGIDEAVPDKYTVNTQAANLLGLISVAAVAIIGLFALR